MHFQTTLLTFSAVAIAAVHSSPIRQYHVTASPKVNTPLFATLERRGADSVLEGLESALINAQEATKKADDRLSAANGFAEIIRYSEAFDYARGKFSSAKAAVIQRKAELKKLALDLTPEKKDGNVEGQ
jgi:hypothetical protein